MCGIIARVGTDDSVEPLLTGLENLEYRGYDSAGIAIQNGKGLEIHKREGQIERLRDLVEREGPTGTAGIGHTRWSTHGAPTDENAHPHTDCTGRIAVVHNGIIENYDDLRARLHEEGHAFESETDTEVIPHLMETHLAEMEPEAAFRATVEELEGSYAVAALVEDTDTVYATREGSPLVVGLKDGQHFLASDVPAFLEFTDEVVYLDDGDVVIVEPGGFSVTDEDGAPVERAVETVDWNPEDAGKGGYDHYMLKEIHEQPTSLRQTTRGRIDTVGDAATLEEFPPGTFADVREVQFVACGTSYHAALYGTRLLADRGVPAQTFLAGEYATNPAPIRDDTLVVAVTQSGETADTLDAVRQAQRGGARTAAVTNVVGSTVTRECDDALYIRAGPEIGVAATKTFSSQVVALSLLAERVAEDAQGVRDAAAGERLAALADLPGNVQRVLDGSRADDIADRYVGSDAYFFIGRGAAHPVALEGALKFKEISYEHAEGFAASELKHGPLALVTEDTPVFAVFTGENDEKTLGNVKEVQARGAPVIAVTSRTDDEIERYADEVLSVPETHPAVAGVLANVQLQLVAYHAAARLDRSIDKPRNLAKSVTVN